MDPLFFAIGALSGCVAVTVGGARAHVLDKRLPKERLPMLEVGMRYQMAHSMALMLTSAAVVSFPGVLPRLAGWGFVTGIVIFPCVLYVYAFTGRRAMLKLTPIGGVVLLASWICLALSPILHSVK